MKVLFIGGHITPALAVIDHALQEVEPSQLVVAGRLHTRPSDRQASFEAENVRKRQLRFVPFEAPKMGTSWSHQPMSWLALLGSVVRAVLLLWAVRPTVIASFGGYLAVPICLAGWLLRIPIITHEQTSRPGSATKLIARWATKIAVSDWTDTTVLPAQKISVTGLPLRPRLFEPAPAPDWLPKSTEPLLYITGGSQGSHTLNQLVAGSLTELTTDWLVVHQCGASTTQYPHLETLNQAAHQLSPTHRRSYIIRESLSESEQAFIYQTAAAVVSRAGANTVAELAAFQLPCVLIPLPHARFDEQQHNAVWLTERQSTARLLPQDSQLSSRFGPQLRQLKIRSRKPVAPKATTASRKVWQLIKDAEASH